MLIPVNKQNELTQLKECSQTKPVATIELAIKAESKTIGLLKKDNAAEALVIVSIMLEMTLQFFAVTNTMNAAQLKETAKLIINEFYFLKLEDLDLFFRRLKTGFYGDLFNRIDGLVIMAKLREYCAERIEKAEGLSLTAHKTVNEPIAGKVFIRTSRGFIRACGDEYEEVDNKEMATTYDYAVALKVVAKLESEPDELKIIPVNKAGSLFDYFNKVGRKDLIHPTAKYTRKPIKPSLPFCIGKSIQ